MYFQIIIIYKLLLMFNILIGRNIQRNKYALDPISLDNIDLMGDWVAEEPALLNSDEVKGMRKIGESINVKKKLSTIL